MNDQHAEELTFALQQLGDLVEGLVHQVHPPAGQAVFNRSPLGATTPGEPINYSTKEGKKFHSLATKSLFPKDEYFDVEPSKFRTFMTFLSGRTKDLGFTSAGGICMVPPNAGTPNIGERINTVEDFGRASMEQIKAWEITFLAATAGADGRNAQDSKMLYDMLMNSLSTQGTSRIEIWKHQCCFKVGDNDALFESGGCLLKVIVARQRLDQHCSKYAGSHEEESDATVHQIERRHKQKELHSIRLPSLCFGFRTASWTTNTQVEGAITSWNLPRPITHP